MVYKMKTAKILIVALVLLLVFTSCGNTEEEIVPEYETGNISEDLGGFSATWGWPGADGESIFGFIPGTANGDRVIKRKNDVEKNLNCSITLYMSNGLLDMLRAGVMSGGQNLDLLTGSTYAMVVDVRAGNLAGLSSLIDVKNVEKWGTPNMLQSLIWKNDIFGVVPFAWPDLVYTSTGHVITVNENIVSRLALEDPREYLENGTWDWDRLEECLESYTFTDNGYTVYGMRTSPSYFAMNMMLANGVALSAFENGEVVCGAYTQAGRVALERAKEIFQVTHSDCFVPNVLGGDPEGFINGNFTMYAAWTSDLIKNTSSIMYRIDNVGILPFPPGPDAKPGVYLSYHEDLPNAIAIPFNAKDTEASAAILSAMLEPFEDFKTKDDIIDYMTEQIFFDRRDAEVIVNVTRNTEYGFFREGARSVIENVTKTNTPASELLEANEDAYAKIVEEYMVPHYQGRIAVYGE